MREKTRAAQDGRAAGRGELRASLDGVVVVRAGWGFLPAGPPHPEQAMASATRQAGRIRVSWRRVST
jgi:hypothetical protein